MMPTCGICLEQCQRLKGERISFSSSSVHLYIQITEGTILSLIWYSGGSGMNATLLD
ncbi:hypothetical protein DAI22_04g033550 [Oryza sativa Japonica Group]|nr:hypothetical protein DAI22_04g033550 [Oryza sativa Japonica Group]